MQIHYKSSLLPEDLPPLGREILDYSIYTQQITKLLLQGFGQQLLHRIYTSFVNPDL